MNSAWLKYWIFLGNYVSSDNTTVKYIGEELIIIDKPYVSNFLKETILKNRYKIIKTDFARESGFTGNTYIIDKEAAISIAKGSKDLKIYTSSENAFGWIAKHLAFTDIPEKIEIFKNKRKFRDLIKPLYPDYFYREIIIDELDNISIDNFPLPFIIKPNVGFFSIA